ncbi:hypothetical protein Peur_011304 [Populus x canadensis]
MLTSHVYGPAFDVPPCLGALVLLILNTLPGPLVHVLQYPLDKGELAHLKREALLVQTHSLVSHLILSGSPQSWYVAAFSGMNLAANGGAEEESHFPSQVEQDVDSHQNYLFGLQGGRNHLKQKTYMKNSESGHFMSSVPPSAILSARKRYGRRSK